MPTALSSNFDLDGMKHTVTALKFFALLVPAFARMTCLVWRFTTIFHEISGLIRLNQKLKFEPCCKEVKFF